MVRTRVAAIKDPSGCIYWQKDLHIVSCSNTSSSEAPDPWIQGPAVKYRNTIILFAEFSIRLGPIAWNCITYLDQPPCGAPVRGYN